VEWRLHQLAHVSEARTLRDFGLGEGGLLHRLESACHVTRLQGQMLLGIALTWFPVVTLAIAQELITGRREPLLYDPAVHVRFLVGGPLLIMADHVFPWICRRSLQQLVQQGFVPDSGLPRFEQLYARARRLADAAWPELVLILGAVAVGVAVLIGLLPISGGHYRVSITPAQVWFSLVASPIVQFLLWRSLWRWLIWGRIVIGLSRIRLRLIATHPDRCGGISFLRLPSVGYCATLLFVASSLICAEWGGHAAIGTTILSFKPFLLMFVVVGAAIAFGPLLFFSPQLFRVRLDGVLEHDGLSAEQCWRFRHTWVEDGREDLLEQQDVQSLDSLGAVYRLTVDRIRYVIFDKRDVIVLVLATLLPVLPVMVFHVPAEGWRDLVELLTGSRLP
jgi:hypothetical protein